MLIILYFIVLFIAPDDSSLIKIIRRQFNCHLISRKNPDIVHTKLPADMSEHHMLVLQLYI